MNLRLILAAGVCAAASYMWGAAPSGYYNKCENRGGADLLQALEEVIGPHTDVGYKGLWTLYRTTDVYPDGKIWDMYTTKHWTYSSEQCGNYSSVGDCYNREHSMPKSWFSERSPMVSDAFHIYPTDGKVNGQRSNYPYGECANGTSLSAPSGIQVQGKLGSSTFPGYSGTVFEPADEYKGDFARSYFYMAACYNSYIDDWDSPMLAGNSYPAFSSWAVDLLLKWHRQDPVSDKEKDRNEAVYAAQHNRNPFIDQPEMAEYIWGTSKNEKWTYASNLDPQILEPVDGSTLDFGYVLAGNTQTLRIDVKTSHLDQPLAIACEGITASNTEIAAAVANAGTFINVSWEPAAAGNLSGSVTFTCGSVKSKVTLTGAAYDRITAKPATNITETGYTAGWTYVGDADAAGQYTVVTTPVGGTDILTKVNAAAESANITGLQPATAYTYYIKSETQTSEPQAFTTAALIPSIVVLGATDGMLDLSGEPGSAGDPIEVAFDAENVTGDIAVSVKAPFEASADKAEWGIAASVPAEAAHFYARINSDKAGRFESPLTLSVGDYTNDDVTLVGIVQSPSAAKVEDFEGDINGCSTYNGCDYKGVLATWHLQDAGIWKGDGGHDSDNSVRMGKDDTSTITATTSLGTGIATVSLYASQWTQNEGPCTFVIDYSADGEEWHETTLANVNTLDWKQYTFAINDPKAQYIRVRQTSGSRFCVDDIEVTNLTSALGAPVVGKLWTAYCLNGELVIESATAATACVYGMDGIVRYDGAVAAGTTAITLASGVYVVALGDETLTVVIR